MTKKPGSFPMAFNDKSWRVVDAVPWIFFGDIPPVTFQAVSTEIVRYVVNESEGSSLKAHLVNSQFTTISALQTYLTRLLPTGETPDSEREYKPLIWCRIAVQFWLKHGGSQEKFISAMTNWISKKFESGAAFVYYEEIQSTNGSSAKIQMPLEVFLFGDIDINDDAFKNVRLKSSKQKVAAPQEKPLTDLVRSAQHSIGKNVLAYVSDLIRDAAKDKNIRSLCRMPDPISQQLYRYTGSRLALYEKLCTFAPECRTKYEKDNIIRAISKTAKCRKYFPKK